ncbi:SDR family NAD(P)-dependent oxidoreductase [Sediminibacillus dalangtanensis]|uniref:SDR family NAD(P)-dependent oxidoreductase n=1 Tax=Sediminibacillus dalangtanensis TaxID=2729421 RepID=A0ABX7VS15_9BACI|nr:SDR family oxidoreductase [Sediminibacillus dalangtanensis]QTM99727.1 SDR family NAD(P)-dependent oxidoreductase [Sediminibacillus dalangtanensis]
MNDRIAGKKILITGASSGLGEEIARKIAEQGGIPILIARSEAKLKRLAEELKGIHGKDIPFYPADLTEIGRLDELFEEIGLQHQQIHGLVNNAGFGVFDYLQDARWEDIENMLQLNVTALIKVVYHMLPHFLRNNSGHIVNIASQAGKLATPKSSVYSASKHAVVGFSNALRLEVEGQGIFVTTVNPGPIATRFFDHADPSGNYRKSVERYMLKADTVAEQIVSSLFRKKREINLPRWMEIGSKLYQISPVWMEKLLKKQFNKK